MPVKKRGRKQVEQMLQISAACQGVPEQNLPLREVLPWVEMMKSFAALPCWVIGWKCPEKNMTLTTITLMSGHSHYTLRKV